MGEVIVVTSLKGGVGKTVFSSGLAYEFAKQGYRTLAVDMDLGTGGLDIALGREDSVLPTFLDLLREQAKPENSLVPGDDGVYFLSAPVFFQESSFEKITQEAFNNLLSFLKDHFDVIVFDMPAGGGAAFPYLENSGLVDTTLLVTTSVPTSVRAAERCAMRLKDPEKTKLVLNGYRLSHPKDNAFGVVEVIWRTSVPIIGVVPFDGLAEKSLTKGIPLTATKKSLAGKAIGNIARRLMEEKVPLLSGITKKKRRSRFYF